LGQHRSTQRKVPCGAPDEERLTADIIELARTYGRSRSLWLLSCRELVSFDSD
jgi:hypothetical protein